MKSILILALFSLSSSAFANGIDVLHAFIAGTHTAQAQFTQTVYDRHHVVRQQSSGSMAFSRPSKFRWVYQKPYAQIIVGDGKKIYLYDEDLSQVTIKSMNHALGSSPAALLAGDNAVEKYYQFSDSGSHGDLTSLIATPKDKESPYQHIEMDFDHTQLVRLIIQDNFGMTTELNLTHWVRNPKLPASDFTFTPPAGADVVSDQP
jgi:outer membrane lipoprotein carrier protein